MSDSHVNWWMDASCRWHQGLPPPGWRQASDGRWHPPAPDDTTEEAAIGPPEGGAHPAGGGRTNLWDAYRGWPPWARAIGPVVAAVLAIGVLGAAATGGLRGGDPETTATEGATTTNPETTTTGPDDVTPAPAPTVTAAAPTTASTPSTSAPAEPDAAPTTVPEAPAPAPPAPDPTNNDINPGAPCSPEGATAVSAGGVPMTCTTQKCHGAPYRQPQWRRTAC
jgi:hypothetical protein